MTDRIEQIPVDLIDTPNRLRTADPARVEALAGMISEVGQLQPIEVVETGERFRLVFGLHRLEAVRSLKLPKIDARIKDAATAIGEAEIRLREILENVGQRPLTKLDRAVHLAAWKDVHEALHPVRGKPEDGQSADDFKSAIFAQRFTTTVQERLGLSRRAIYLAVAIARGIGPEIRERIAFTWLADHQRELEELAAEPAKRQTKIIELLFAVPPKAASVVDAIAILDKVQVAPTTPVARLSGTFERMPKAQQFAFLDSILDTVDAWLAERRRQQ